jgi:hypothetical protein
MSNSKCSVLLTLFDSQEDLISREIKGFLNIEDFCHLDSSICNHERRREILKCFNGQSFEGSKRVTLGDAFLLWARERGILIKKLSWKIESKFSVSLLLYLCEYQGLNLKTLTISDVDYSNDGHDEGITDDDIKRIVVVFSPNLE